MRVYTPVSQRALSELRLLCSRAVSHSRGDTSAFGLVLVLWSWRPVMALSGFFVLLRWPDGTSFGEAPGVVQRVLELQPVQTHTVSAVRPRGILLSIAICIVEVPDATKALRIEMAREFGGRPAALPLRR